MDTTAPEYDPDYVGRALDDLLAAIWRTERAMDKAGMHDHPIRRDVTACRTLIAGLYHRLPHEIVEGAQR